MLTPPAKIKAHKIAASGDNPEFPFKVSDPSI
jgi:hypothetical protein